MFAHSKSLILTAILLVAFSSCFVPQIYAQEEPWTKKKSMQVARGHVGATVVDGKIYAIGGDRITLSGNCIVATYGTVVNTTEVYDPTTDTWTYKTPMPTPRADFAVAVYQNKIYCIGGHIGNNEFTGINEVYDPATDTWETKTPMPTPRADLQAHLVGGKIFLIGGRTGSTSAHMAVNEVYDPVTDTWTTQASSPYRITTGASAVSEDKIYYLATSSHLDLGPFLQIYSPKDDSWTIQESAPTYGGWSTTAAVTSPAGDSQKIAFFSESSTCIYFPANSSWLIGTPIPSKQGFARAVFVDDTFYVIGGIPAPFSGYIVITASTAAVEQYKPNEANLTTPSPDTKIYIRADGVIEPSTANITTTDNVFYTFTANNYERLVIERDNIIVDGKGFTLEKTSSVGVSLFERQNVTIKNLNVKQFLSAEIGMENSADITITGNRLVADLNEGVEGYSCSNITITNNTMSGGTNAIWLRDSNNNKISNNNMGEGITLTNSENNIITHNRITGIPCIGISYSSNNQIYLNSFMYSSYLGTARTHGEAINSWNSSYPSGGNYWVDYNGTDADGDGIGETPYVIDENNIDYQPIIAPINSFGAGTWEWTKYYVDVVSNATVFDFVFDPEQNKIDFSVTTEKETTSFCRVTIPKDLLDVEDNNWLVLFSGDALENLITDEDTNNNYLYFNHDYQTELIEIIGTTAIPEFQPWTIPAFFMATALVAVMYYKRIQKTVVD